MSRITVTVTPHVEQDHCKIASLPRYSHGGAIVPMLFTAEIGFRLAYSGRGTMPMAVLATIILTLSGVVSFAATATPRPTDNPRTMDDVVDRVMINENRLKSQIRQYSPLVETYLQYQKPDKDLGYAPAGDKYFLGRADFAE